MEPVHVLAVLVAAATAAGLAVAGMAALSAAMKEQEADPNFKNKAPTATDLGGWVCGGEVR